jgi:hypothetical protein
MSLDLVGLGIGSPLTSFSPTFDLRGLGLAYSQPPLEIAGAFVDMAPVGSHQVEFEGGVTIGATDITLEAFGYYGQVKDGGGNEFTSMFIFGDVAYDFGGPPAFFVTGVALGFGYNSNLTLPTIDQVDTFPFVQVLPTSVTPNPNALGGSKDPLAVLNQILKPANPPAWVDPEAGSLWFAAGITFTSFELVNSQALVTVEVGHGLVIALIGTSRAQFPQEGTAYANIELDLLVRFAPSEGVFSAQAVLAPSSFVLDSACKLTGGFAFFVWFGDNPHAGDFVLTLGGYNPGFTPPSYYPSVPAVGFDWSVDSSITISGGAYLALTPSVMMAGGRLGATYQDGNLRAWFDAHADVIIRWKPFWIDAGIGITIGASYKLNLLFTSVTVSVELGCDVELWGPPTGGTVTVDWYVISFTIGFGQGKQGPQLPKQWSDIETMLPNTGSTSAVNVLSLSPTSGLLNATTSPPEQHTAALTAAGDGGTAASWTVQGSRFAFQTSSAIPATRATVGATHTFNGSEFKVHPLGWDNVSSTYSVTIEDSQGNDVSGLFDAGQTQRSVPASLWGSPPEGDSGPLVPSGDAQLVADQIVGVTVEAKPPLIGASPGPVEVEAYLTSVQLDLPAGDLPLSGSAQPTGDLPVNSSTTVATIADTSSGIASTGVTAARTAIFDALQSVGYAAGATNDDMTDLAGEIACALAAEPLLVS